MLNFIKKDFNADDSFYAIYKCDVCRNEEIVHVSSQDFGIKEGFSFLAEDLFDRDPYGFLLKRKNDFQGKPCCIPKNKLVRYIPSETLRRFHNCKEYVRGIRGPIGSGKSSACCLELFKNSSQQEAYNGVRKTIHGIIRNTYGELKTTTVKTWLNWFGDMTRMTFSSPIRGIVNYNLPDGTKVESELIFVSQDRPKDIARLLSLELTSAWINEAKEVPYSALDAKGRTDRYPDPMKTVAATHPCMIMDTNSCDISCWWYDYAEKQTPEGYAFFDQPPALIKRQEGKEFIYEPNPKAENIQYLASGYAYYMRQVAGKPREWVDVYILNQYGSPFAGNRIYEDYSKDNHTDVEFNPGLPIRWTNDFNYSPLSSAILQVNGDNVYAVDEIIIKHADVLQAAIEFAERYKDFKHLPVHIYGDASGHAGAKHGQITNYIKLREYLERNGFIVKMHVPRANPGIRDGQNAVRAKICDATGRRTFFVNPKKCRTIDEGFMTLNAKEGSTFLEDETSDSQHVLSAIRYMIHVLYPVKMKAPN